MGRNKRSWVLICFLLLLGSRSEGEGEEKMDCVRFMEEIVVHVASHNFGYLERFNTMVQNMVSKSLLPPNLGEMINRQLKISTRDVCKVRTIQLPRAKPTPRWVGRIPRRRRQAFLGGILATLGLLEIGRTIEHLLEGDGYGSNFQHYLTKIRRTEQSFNIRISKLEERIKKLEEVQHAELVVQEIEAILDIEAGEWEDIRTLEEDLRGNSILREGFEAAEKIFVKRNLTKRTTVDQGLEKIKIDKRLRSVTVKVRPHAVCKWAVLTVTSITAVPSKDCYKKVGVDQKKNLTYAESIYDSCLVLGSWETAVELADGSFVVPSNAWELKRTQCKDALKNQAVSFHVDRGDVFIGSGGAFVSRASCGEAKELTLTLKNTSITPKHSCRGWASVNGLQGKRDEWAALKTTVSAGKPGVRGVLVYDNSWIFDAYREVETEEEEEVGEEEEQEDEYQDWDWTWEEKTSVGTGTSSVVVGVLVAGVLVWRTRGRRKKIEETTYVNYRDVKTNDVGNEEEDEEPELKEEALISKELGNISRLTEGIMQAGEGMNLMLHHINKMHEDLEVKETGSEMGEAWRLANTASNVPFSSGGPQLPGPREDHE